MALVSAAAPVSTPIAPAPGSHGWYPDPQAHHAPP
jgi:hypothetical protein